MTLTEKEALAIQTISGEQVLSEFPIHHGGNNRSKWVQTRNNRFFIKHYFRHQDDSRDRLSVEFGFLDFLNQLKVARVSRPVWQDTEAGFAVYSYLDGEPVTRIKKDYLVQAVAFLKQINRDHDQAREKGLPNASEACFSSQEYIENLAHRINRLEQLEVSDQLDQQAKAFIKQTLIPGFNSLTEVNDQEFYVAPEERIVSPSDFGFHNTLATKEGLCFFDFEYAGWDDPAKLIADFFCQPKVPVSIENLDFFVNEVSALLPDVNGLKQRLDFVTKIIQLKWCCILLNEFLQVGQSRRHFADEHVDTQRKQKQLRQAQIMFNNIKIR